MGGVAPEPPKGDNPEEWVFMRKIVLMRNMGLTSFANFQIC